MMTPLLHCVCIFFNTLHVHIIHNYLNILTGPSKERVKNGFWHLLYRSSPKCIANRDTVRDNFNKVLDIIGLIISYHFDVKYLNFHEKKKN